MRLAGLIFFLGMVGNSILENEDELHRRSHRVVRRQASSILEAPQPYTVQDPIGAPLPYQQGERSSNGNSNRDYQGPYPTYSRRDPSRSEEENPRVYSRHAGAANAAINYSPSGGRPYYQSQPPVSMGRRQSDTLGIVGTPGTGYSSYGHLPAAGTSRSSQGRTYSYPFGQGPNVAAPGASDEGDDGADDQDDDEGEAGAESHGRQFGDGGYSVNGGGEPTVQAFASEPTTVSAINPDQLSREAYQQLLRQRHLERQRLLQQRQQQAYAQGQASRQQQASARGAVQGAQSSASLPSSSSSSSASEQRQQRPSIQQLGSQGLPAHQNAGVLRPYGSSNTGYGSSSSGYGQQLPLYTHSYGHGWSDDDGYDSECPNTGIRIQINGIPCETAIDHYGSYLCYRHEYTSRECCLRCRGLKNAARVGCEYGDHSGRCQQLQSYDCYDLRNRQSCCQTCERMQKPGARAGCEYGDMTPNCDRVRQSPGLCYIPENRYLCCETCSNIRSSDDPECPWGDQNPDLCQPFDRSGNVRINCYAPPIRRLCCNSCRRLEEWIPYDQPGCQYGDKPVTFNTGSHRNLNCTTFLRYFGQEQCSLNQAVMTNCCYTCHRYAQG